jgi:hypothetical protein
MTGQHESHGRYDRDESQTRRREFIGLSCSRGIQNELFCVLASVYLDAPDKTIQAHSRLWRWMAVRVLTHRS